MAKHIQLSQGKTALVSDEDFERVSKFKWTYTYNPDGRTGRYGKEYAVRREKSKRVYLHRFVLDTPKGMVCDHIDNDGLNCQRENLVNTYQHVNCTRGKNPENHPCL